VLTKLYKWLYTRIGGEPWTFIIRREQKKFPLAFMLLFLALGIVVGKYAKKHYWQLLIAFWLGILCGHFWF